METGNILFFLTLFFEGYCVANHQKDKADVQKRYKAVEGETFRIPCFNCSKLDVESTSPEGYEGGRKGSFLDCGKRFTAEAKHSGNYSCFTNGHKLFFHLRVVEKMGCFQPNKNLKFLVAVSGGDIPCPGFTCSNSTAVTWYKNEKKVSEQKRVSSVKRGVLHLNTVTEKDTGVFFCDTQIIEEGVIWIFRTAVEVKVIPPPSNDPPRIPAGDATEEVEIGQPHTLSCKAFFPFELNFSSNMEWYMNNDGNMTLLDSKQNSTNNESLEKYREEYEVIQVAFIKEVTPQNLAHTYTCIASNTFGNVNATIKLKRKLKVQWPSLVGYPVTSFLLVAGLGIIVHVKWLEIQLIHRSYFQTGRQDGDEKEFDVFLSYVWSPPSAEVTESVTTSSRSPPNDEEGSPCITGLLDEQNTRPLEVLLPQVLEDQWGYRLCLLERDVLPGGAYTNDVVLAIKKSRMLICVLSDNYLTNSNAVFVLESGVQALLQKSVLKLLLLWTSKDSASLIQPDPPLPTLLQKALKVLPSLDWRSGKPPRSSFWRSLRKLMPNNKVALVSVKQH
ncbi:interleukin-18 receptor accessory protein-like [Archocentrus centrarchus]|uniref:interleukin-18 receptor accessory protein-like n=1 Tax=Archocentrus centrarchus TaxID=63155 RepID=UPI0011EA0C7E|nr:interleukin-18 receptor accessory protein-like [Archocentrus centrarchus]